MHAPIDLKSGLKSVTYVVLFVFAIAVQGGCSESPEPAASAPEASVTKPAPDAAIAKALPGEEAAPQLPSTFYPEDDVPRGKPAPQDSPAGKPSPADDRAKSPAESSEPSELERTPSAESAAKTSPAAEKGNVAPPATVFAAMKLLDLRKLPRMPGTEATVDTPTQVSLTAKASVSAAKKFYTDLLETEGWQLVPPDMAMPDSEDYGQLNFTQAGFHLGISLYKLPDSGLLSVGLNNYGNYDARQLPQPAGSEPLYTSFHVAMYVTSDKVRQVAEACGEQLQAAGWQWYIHPFTAYTEDAQQRSLTFKQNGLGLSAYIAVAPAQMNRTTVQYSIHMLGDELPIPADATKIEFLESPLQLTCETKDEILPTLDFFRRELAARGWQEKGTGNQATNEAVSVFQRSEGLPIVLKITRLGDDVPTSVSIAEFEMPREVPVETLTDNKKPAGNLPAVDGIESDLPEGLAGLMTYEDWLKKNKYQPSLARLEQYAAEMEKAANSLAGEPAESDEVDRSETPESKPMKKSAASGPSAKASGPDELGPFNLR